MIARILIFVAIGLAYAAAQASDFDELVLRVMEGFEPSYKRSINKGALANWKYSTNITAENSEALTQARLDQEEFSKMYCKIIEEFILKNVSIVKNNTLNRWVGLVVGNGCGEDNDNKTARSKKINQLSAAIQSMYSTAKVNLDGVLHPLDPDLYEIMRRSRDFVYLLRAWKGWYDESTKNMKPVYTQLVDLWNEVSKENGFADRGAQWKSIFEHRGDFETDLETIWQQIKPLYAKVHAYTRDKLKKFYVNHTQFFPNSGHMPAHILTNMWAQAWGPLGDILLPYPGKPSIDITPSLINQNYTVRKMFNKSDEFFQSLGLPAMPEKFWKNSMLERPDDGREVVCHASAWNLMDGDDVRIKMCTKRTHEDFLVIHHEMGHIMYYLHYNDKPAPFQTGANPGFHEAIGDAISLSVNTPKHLKAVNLITDGNFDNEMKLNYLMKTALDKIVFFPFGYLVDLWRWKVFDGRIKDTEYSKQWWDLVCKYQGVYPPVKREPNGFDPGAKYHIPANSQYISYFIAHVLQFTFYKRMCDIAGQSADLVNCDYFKNTDAGEAFGKMMKWGYSQHWSDTLAEFTGDSTYNTAALLAYFKPLDDYLTEYLANNSIEAGWNETACPNAPDFYIPPESNMTTIDPTAATKPTTTRLPDATTGKTDKPTNVPDPTATKITTKLPDPTTATTKTLESTIKTTTTTPTTTTSTTTTTTTSTTTTKSTRETPEAPSTTPEPPRISVAGWVGIGVGSAAGVAAVGGGVGFAVYWFKFRNPVAVEPISDIPMS